MIDVVTGSDPDVTSFPLSSIRIHVEKVNQEFFYQLRNICGAACKGKLVWRSSVYEINLPACHHDHADDDSNQYVLLKRILCTFCCSFDFDANNRSTIDSDAGIYAQRQ